MSSHFKTYIGTICNIDKVTRECKRVVFTFIRQHFSHILTASWAHLTVHILHIKIWNTTETAAEKAKLNYPVGETLRYQYWIHVEFRTFFLRCWKNPAQTDQLRVAKPQVKLVILVEHLYQLSRKETVSDLPLLMLHCRQVLFMKLTQQ